MGDYPRPRHWRSPETAIKPLKTCPVSRHTAMIADELRDPKSPIRKLMIEAGYEPDHWASSLEVTVMTLWEARRYLEWERLPPTKQYRYNGHWVPIKPPQGV